LASPAGPLAPRPAGEVPSANRRTRFPSSRGGRKTHGPSAHSSATPPASAARTAPAPDPVARAYPYS
jgi:hypothetical protein